MPGGGRSTYPVDTLALAVTDPSDITVEASPETIILAPGGTATIDVTVTRKAGFDKGVNLAIVLEHLGGVHANPLPPGVTVREAGSKTLLGPKETKGKIILASGGRMPPPMREGPDRRHGPRVDQLRRQDGVRERADRGERLAQVTSSSRDIGKGASQGSRPLWDGTC